MIRLSEELSNINESDFNAIIEPFYRYMDKYLNGNFISEYVAHFIAKKYEFNALWNETLIGVVEEAIESLAAIETRKCNINEIKSILENKYNLKVLNDNNLDLEEIKA